MLPIETNGGRSENDDESIKFGERARPRRTIVRRGKPLELQQQVLQLNSCADHEEAGGAADASTSSG